jgi:acetyl esterase
MTLDAASTALVEQSRASGARPIQEMAPAEARALGEAMLAQYGPGPEMARTWDTRVPVSGGAVPVRVLLPPGPVTGLMVYYHGGGWVTGCIDDRDTLARKLAVEAGCAVVLPAYRLAPEYRFPTAVDDSHAVARWAARQVTEITGGDLPLVVAGDSAGGNLAAVVALRARQQGGPAIAAQILAYPVLDCDFDTLSYSDSANDLLLTRDAMIWFWDQYLPVPAARTHPDASPLRSPDVYGLPPAIILTPEYDVLRDEGELYATRLVKAGVPVRHQRFAGQMHGFLSLTGLVPGSDLAVKYIADALRATLAAEPVV